MSALVVGENIPEVGEIWTDGVARIRITAVDQGSSNNDNTVIRFARLVLGTHTTVDGLRSVRVSRFDNYRWGEMKQLGFHKEQEQLPGVGETWTDNRENIMITSVDESDDYPGAYSISFQRLLNGEPMPNENYRRSWHNFQGRGFHRRGRNGGTGGTDATRERRRRDAEVQRAEQRRRKRESRMLARQMREEVEATARRQRDAEFGRGQREARESARKTATEAARQRREQAEREARQIRETNEELKHYNHLAYFAPLQMEKLKKRKESMRVQGTCPLCIGPLGWEVGGMTKTRSKKCHETLLPDRNPNNYFQMCECNHTSHRNCFYQYLFGGYVTDYPMEISGAGACNWILENLQDRISFDTRAEGLHSDDEGKILRYTAPYPYAFGYVDKWQYDTFSYQRDHSKSKLILSDSRLSPSPGKIFRHLEVKCPNCQQWNFLASNYINDGRLQSGKIQFKSLDRFWNGGKQKHGAGVGMFDKLQIKF